MSLYSFVAGIAVPQAIGGAHTLLARGSTSGRSAGVPFTMLPDAFLAHVQGNAGSQDVLKGAGFAPHETVLGYWNGTQSVPFAVTATTSNLGSFGVAPTSAGITFTVPLSPTGGYAVYALGQSSHAGAHAAFTLSAHLGVTPGSAPPGGMVTVSGTGYGAGESVPLKYNCGAITCASTTVLATPTTDANGTFSVAVTLPSTTSVGVHNIGGKGSISGVFATTTITIT